MGPSAWGQRGPQVLSALCTRVLPGDDDGARQAATRLVGSLARHQPALLGPAAPAGLLEEVLAGLLECATLHGSQASPWHEAIEQGAGWFAKPQGRRRVEGASCFLPLSFRFPPHSSLAQSARLIR